MSQPEQTDDWPVGPIGRVAAPIRQQATDTIRRAILDLEIMPGQRLIERELIERLQVSRTTVRESLRDLVSEGLVAIAPQGGAIVAVPTRDEAADMYMIRASLESLVLRRFIDHAGEATMGHLREALAGLAQVVDGRSDPGPILEAKARFYAVLDEGAESPALRQLLTILKARVQTLRATSLARPGRPAQMLAEITAIAEAVLRRDADAAIRLNAVHIDHAMRIAQEALYRADTGAPNRTSPRQGGPL